MAYDIAVVISTFERPDHLERCLASLEVQRGVAGRFEVVVVDDGSRDDTLQRVEAIARRAGFPLRYTTHPHHGFRLARCRNAGIAASSAEYLLFTDGDCVLPPDHLLIHLQERRAGFVAAGGCVRIDRRGSALVTHDLIRLGDVTRLVPHSELARLRRKALRGAVYRLLRVPMRPRLSGSNIGAWRTDLERINGFDEGFVGWGLEDVDLQRRLACIGVRVRPIMHRTAVVHMWHEPAPSFARNGVGTVNERYFLRPDWTAFCVDGLVKEADAAVIVPLPQRSVPAFRRAA